MRLKGKKLYLTVLLFAAPGLCLYLFLVLFQIIQGIEMSFFSWPTLTEKVFVGIQNYKRIFTNVYFWRSFKNTLLYMLLTSALQLSIGFFVGYLLYLQMRGYKFFRLVVFLPAVLAGTSVAFIWQYMYSPAFGILKPLFELLGISEYYIPPLSSEKLALVSIIFAQVWGGVGIQIMMFNSSFMRIPQDVVEAAIVDGVKGFGMIKHIMFPLSLDVGKVIIILQVVGSLKAFDLVYVMTKGGPNHATELLGMTVYKTAFERFKFGEGNAVAVVIFALCLLMTLVLQKVFKTDND